jgi:hypothetical protein
MIAKCPTCDRRAETIRTLEEAVAQYKLWLSDSLDREAILRADQNERGRLT